MEIRFASLILSLNSLTNKEIILIVLIIAEVVMSLVTVIAYKNDKVRAKKGLWRTKESVLLLLPWLMGGLGGFMGIYSIRHKTQHWYFPLNNVLALIVQASIFISVAILL